VATLAVCDITPALIVDSGAADDSLSPEGIAVTPRARFRHQPGDLIVLSSQTFEREMWDNTDGIRNSDGDVLGLYGIDHVSDSLVPRVSLGTRIVLGIAPIVSSTRLTDHQPPQSTMEISYAAVE
jgi:ABC-type dipeptide/oligopeptide/nickel transport system permease subunit